jgi:hypothetical protein
MGMSEYQYYEFQAIDRPLTPEEQDAVSRLSSRVEPHPWRAVFTYSYGDFPGDPEKILAQYYDAMLYLANWGSHQLVFRFPRALVDLDQMRQYAVQTLDYPSDSIDFSSVGEYAILNIQFHEEGGGGWIEGEGWLGSLLSLRDDLLHRDYRLLYLAWLKGLTMEDTDEDALEPPLPPGLRTLTPALQSFVELFEVDEDLIQVAAEASGELESVTEDDLRRAIARLSPEERDAFLLRLARGEPQLSLAFKRRLGAVMALPHLCRTTPARAVQPGRAGAGRPELGARRTVGQLFAAAEDLRERERQEQAARTEAKRMAELEALAGRGERAWQEVDTLIQQSTGNAYDQAVRLLVKLKELAQHQGQDGAFQVRVARIEEQYARRRALMERLRRAGLV